MSRAAAGACFELSVARVDWTSSSTLSCENVHRTHTMTLVPKHALS